ncbi:contractile injection system protein, VgrG/Pvc8 family, partial [Klebsiella pneumoniae]|uniref:contractile injection system protein, VgrG/Pvc8 family n=1 Tax=Klebsiella pneumoniae TaxID=573 RepID=UPI003BF3D96D
DQATASSSSQLEKLNQHFTDMHASRAKYFKAYSSVRDTQVGYWFNLREHPEIDQHEGADQEFLIIAKNFYNQNNLPKDLQQQVSQLLTQSRWDQNGYDDIERQGNELTLIRR